MFFYCWFRDHITHLLSWGFFYGILWLFVFDLYRGFASFLSSIGLNSHVDGQMFMLIQLGWAHSNLFEPSVYLQNTGHVYLIPFSYRFGNWLLSHWLLCPNVFPFILVYDRNLNDGTRGYKCPWLLQLKILVFSFYWDKCGTENYTGLKAGGSVSCLLPEYNWLCSSGKPFRVHVLHTSLLCSFATSNDMYHRSVSVCKPAQKKWEQPKCLEIRKWYSKQVRICMHKCVCAVCVLAFHGVPFHSIQPGLPQSKKEQSSCMLLKINGGENKCDPSLLPPVSLYLCLLAGILHPCQLLTLKSIP